MTMVSVCIKYRCFEITPKTLGKSADRSIKFSSTFSARRQHIDDVFVHVSVALYTTEAKFAV